MKPYRSMLFVPGHKTKWVDKGSASGADALILDLEDSVPPDLKHEARDAIAGTLQRSENAAFSSDIWVRPNSMDSGYFSNDLESVVGHGLSGLFLPKVADAEEVVKIDAILSHIEEQKGVAVGSIGLIASFETAYGMSRCEEIATASSRMWTLLGATGPDADVARAVGFEFSEEGLESLYLRSRILLAARAAGMNHPIAGLWQDIADIDGLRRFAVGNRAIGYRGMVLIHPSHVATVNEVFTPADEVVAYSRRLLEAYNRSAEKGSSAINFEGQHVDIAHVRTAETVIELADSIRGK